MRKQCGRYIVLTLAWLMMATGAIRLPFSAQDALPPPLPPIPMDSGDMLLLMPDVVEIGTLDETAPASRYIMVARRGNEMTIVMRRTQGVFTPRLHLLSPDGDLLEDVSANDLAGRTATLHTIAETDAWYFVEATYDGEPPDSGGYSLELKGTSPLLYGYTQANLPPEAEDGQPRIVFRESQIEGDVEGEAFYWLPLYQSETVTLKLDAEDVMRLILTDDGGEVLAALSLEGGMTEGTVEYTSPSAQWILVTLSAREQIAYTLDVVLGAASDEGTATQPAPRPVVLGDLLTPTFTYTPTNTPTYTPTPTFTLTFTPTYTLTPTLTPTHTLTPSITPTPEKITCAGYTSQFVLGEMAVVDFNRQSALRILLEYDAPVMRTIAQAYNDEILELIEGPICVNNLIYWKVHYAIANVYGWVNETDESKDPFLCRVENPECRRFGQ